MIKLVIPISQAANLQTNNLSGMRNVEGLQEIHEAYQILLKIILANKDRFKKKSKVHSLGRWTMQISIDHF